MIPGFRFSAVAAGVKHAGTDRLDFGLIVADEPCAAAAVTTTNIVCAAPVEITRKRVSKGSLQAVVVNSGNANAFTGPNGAIDALHILDAVGDGLKLDPTRIAPMSTGVIGVPLPCDRMIAAVPKLVAGLSPDGFPAVARAIMTTDTKPKTVFLHGELSNGPVSIAGMAKGAGMIAPNMATMLSVILTDVRVDPVLLKTFLASAAAGSFNAVTIDGDTSTNDTVIVLSGGKAQARYLPDSPADHEAFANLLAEACRDLARQIVLDGEGATKAVTIKVIGAPHREGALKVARTIAESPLVKTALHGEDPNWGRIVAAAGRAGVRFDPDLIDLTFGDVPVVRAGQLASADWEPKAHAVMKEREFTVTVDLKAGDGRAELFTTDFSEEYVSINADYRS